MTGAGPQLPGLAVRVDPTFAVPLIVGTGLAVNEASRVHVALTWVGVYDTDHPSDTAKNDPETAPAETGTTVLPPGRT